MENPKEMEFLTIAEIADILKVKKLHARELMHEAKIAFKLGKTRTARLYVTAEDFKKWLNERMSNKA